MDLIVLLEATLTDYSPPVAVQNPFKPARKYWLPSILATTTTRTRRNAGKVQVIRRQSRGHSSYWLHFEAVDIRNDRDLPLYVLLSRASDTALDDDHSIRQFEAKAQPLHLDNGPEGQWKGSHFPQEFEQELLVFDPMVFKSVAIAKPAVAKPPTAQAVVYAYGAFQAYIPPTKSPEQVAQEMEALSTRLLQTVMEMEQDELQSEDELSLDALQRNANQLFRMFDQDKSNSIDFEEYKQMLAYRKLNLLESKAKRFFQLVDDQNKGYIDEREFVTAMYITNYLRKQKQQSSKATDPSTTLSPTDVFHQLDDDSDELLNTFEYEKALELLGVPMNTKRSRAKARSKFPKAATAISLEQFKRAWVELVDVRAELQKRDVKGAYPRKAKKDLQNALLDAIHQEEQEELRVALQAKEEVVRLEKERRDAEQEESRRLFQLQRQAAMSTRTKEALRERQERLDRKKQKAIRDQQAREERRLLDRAQAEAEKRVIHERQVVQELMATKMERITRHKARCGDDVVDLCGRELKELPYDLYHGRDALTSLSSLLILDLSRNKIQSLPGSIFSHLFSLRSLDVSNNELEKLPAEIGEARDLQSFDARSNRLTAVPVGLKNLRELRVLHLAYNCLVKFGDDCEGLNSLEELNLSSNALEALGDAMGDSLPKLLRLDLRGNPTLRYLPNSLQRLRSLMIWDLCACDQKRFGKQVFGEQLQGLRSLNLSFNSLASLPEGIGRLAQLQELNLKSNQLASLPRSLGDLSELVTLNAENNALGDLPPGCGEHWSSMETLRLSHNRLSVLPPTLGLMHSVCSLHVSNNQLTGLPIEFGALVRLRELDVSWNLITSIPEELGGLELLTTADFSHNQLVGFPTAITKLQRLRCLRCSHNRLTTPLESGISQLQSLRYVDLAQNQLTELESCLYELTQLEVLNLSGNRIALLPREMADHCGALRKLDLYSNRLRALPLEWADSLLPQLDVLSIDRNPLTLLPDKTSSTWELKDQYQTSFSNGYTSTEAKAWVADQRICYPVFVRVWEELKTSSCGDNENNATKSGESPIQATSNEFCNRVKEVMASSDAGPWQSRYERLARHYFYEFKHMGHPILLASIENQQGQQNKVIEDQLQQQRLQRAESSIQECNRTRQRLATAYRADEDVLATATQHANARRNEHRKEMLQKTCQDMQAIQTSFTLRLEASKQRHLDYKRNQRLKFADEMKHLARERAQMKQKVRNREVLAVASDEVMENEPQGSDRRE